jgi:anti-sigma factor RsiW
MNCEKAHRQIHLFSELTDQERDQTLQHIDECEHCKALAESMGFMNDVVARIGKVTPEPANSYLLTSKIMREVRASDQKMPNLMERFLSLIELTPVRWTMAAGSAVLILLFALEQTQSTQTDKVYSIAPLVETKITILNAKNFQTQLNKYRETKKTIHENDCKDPFKKSQFSIACLREKEARLRNL